MHTCAVNIIGELEPILAEMFLKKVDKPNCNRCMISVLSSAWQHGGNNRIWHAAHTTCSHCAVAACRHKELVKLTFETIRERYHGIPLPSQLAKLLTAPREALLKRVCCKHVAPYCLVQQARHRTA